MKEILITGGAGFIGFNLAKQINKKKLGKITIIDNFSRGKNDTEFQNYTKKNNIRIINKDLTKKIHINKKYDLIFHLAAIVGVKNVNQNPEKTIKVNLLPIFELIKCLKDQNSKIIFFSTSEVYSQLIKNKNVKFPIREKEQISLPVEIINRDSYFLSKIFCEKILELSNTNYIIFRPHNIYGPRMGYSHVIPELIKKMSKLKKINIFSPNHKRAFCFVDDSINQILSIALNKKLKRSIYNIGNSKEEIKIYDLAKKIKFKLNSRTKLKKGKVTLGSPPRRVPSMRKTIKCLNKRPRFINIETGLQKTINWYLKNDKKN